MVSLQAVAGGLGGVGVDAVGAEGDRLGAGDRAGAVLGRALGVPGGHAVVAGVASDEVGAGLHAGQVDVVAVGDAPVMPEVAVKVPSLQTVWPPTVTTGLVAP